MHRSGTTMLCRLLEELGLFVGKSKRKNYEATFFQKINKYLLYQANATWDDPENIRYLDEDYYLELAKVLRKRINSPFFMEYLGLGKYLSQLSGTDKKLSWGWKDPVNSLTIDMWKAIYPQAKIIYVYRNPIDVAASLQKRELKRRASRKLSWKQRWKQFMLFRDYQFNQSYRIFDLKQGILLWEQYIKQNEKSALKYQGEVLKIKYEDLLESPEKKLEEIAGFCGLNCNHNQIQKASEMVDSGRKYSFVKDEDLVKLYREIKEMETVKFLGYDGILK